MKKLLLYLLASAIVILLVLLFFFRTNNNNSQLENTTQDRQVLELEKQRLEVRKLRDEISSITINPLLQAGTLAAALIAAAISFWSAWRSQKNQIMIIQAQTEQQQKNHISNLLKELGSEQIPVKIAAIHALSEYESAIPFLVSTLRVDNDPRILIPIETALLQHPENSLKQVLEINRTVNKQRFELAAKFIALDHPADMVAEILSIHKSSLEKSLRSSRFIQTSKKIKAKLNQGELLKKNSDEIRQELLDTLLQERDQILNILENTRGAMEKLIKKVSLLEKPFVVKGASLEGIILNRLNLSGWSFEHSDLRNAKFSETICENANFSNVLAPNVSFFGANLESAKLDNAFLEETNFGTANCKNLSMTDSNCNYSKFNGANFQSANLTDSKFFEGQFNGTIFTEATLQKCKFFRAKFVSGYINKANCDDSYWGGTIIKGVKLSESTFRKAKIEGVSFKKCDFENADFSTAEFKSITDFAECLFSDVKTEKTVFAKDCLEFEKALLEKISGSKVSDT